MRRLRGQLTYANVIATVALFLALAGGAYAATQLPKNSVGPKQIAKNAVRSSKVKDGSLLAKDFKAGQLAGCGGGASGKGTAGPSGPLVPPARPGHRARARSASTARSTTTSSSSSRQSSDGSRGVVRRRRRCGRQSPHSSRRSGDGFHAWGIRWSPDKGLQRAVDNEPAARLEPRRPPVAAPPSSTSSRPRPRPARR